MRMGIKIVKGDITTLAVDAIVNAAKIAVREVEDFLTQRRRDAECAETVQNGRARTLAAPQMEVIFCCFFARDAAVYEILLS